MTKNKCEYCEHYDRCPKSDGLPPIVPLSFWAEDWDRDTHGEIKTLYDDYSGSVSIWRDTTLIGSVLPCNEFYKYKRRYRKHDRTK